MSEPKRIMDLAISETGFVFDPLSGGTFTLNETGKVIVKAMQDGLSHAEIVEKLRSEFEGVTSKLDEDVQDFVRTLTDFGLLTD